MLSQILYFSASTFAVWKEQFLFILKENNFCNDSLAEDIIALFATILMSLFINTKKSSKSVNSQNYTAVLFYSVE